MHKGILFHGAFLPCHHADSAFGNSVLVKCTDAQKLQILIGPSEQIRELFGLLNTTFTVVCV